MKQKKLKIPNRLRAEENRKRYKGWKEVSLSKFGYFPIFQPLKETSLLRNLSGNALRLYIYLGLRTGNETGETWISIETMANYFGKSQRTISGWLKELEKVQLIERFQLKPNEVAHTFLLPYGRHLMSDKNNLQKNAADQLDERENLFDDEIPF